MRAKSIMSLKPNYIYAHVLQTMQYATPQKFIN